MDDAAAVPEERDVKFAEATIERGVPVRTGSETSHRPVTVDACGEEDALGRFMVATRD